MIPALLLAFAFILGGIIPTPDSIRPQPSSVTGGGPGAPAPSSVTGGGPG
jgi:hypothetical protein